MDKSHRLVFHKQRREFEWLFLVHIGCIPPVLDTVRKTGLYIHTKRIYFELFLKKRTPHSYLDILLTRKGANLRIWMNLGRRRGIHTITRRSKMSLCLFMKEMKKGSILYIFIHVYQLYELNSLLSKYLKVSCDRSCRSQARRTVVVGDDG